MSLLKVENLNQYYGKNKILNNISFDLNSGEVVAFLGPNGAGKTTLLRTVAGLLKTESHDIHLKLNLINFKNNIINNYSVSDRVSMGLLYLPQQTSLFKQMSVIDNLKLIFKYHNYWDNNKNKLNIFNQELESWLLKTNLTNHKKQLAGSLSGGQKRKLEVIRSILMHPEAILLDEPFAGVDPKSIYELKEIFANLAKENIAVLISDHNVDQLLSIANRVYVVIKGEIIKTGTIKDIINDNATKEMYFGYEFYKELSDKFL
ncbi:MAG: Sulfate-transporting ATPase [candidate division TM6 bacterium GW2011_GWF2_28_16]|nr:MAG: Sulfate-transporting ATPase [candidate division TM6 bacterium GW2011_GWF2_28_16]